MAPGAGSRHRSTVRLRLRMGCVGFVKRRFYRAGELILDVLVKRHGQKVAMRIGDAESGQPNPLNEFGEDRIREFQAALAKIDPPAVAHQQIVLEEPCRARAENALEALAEARLEIVKRESVA